MDPEKRAMIEIQYPDLLTGSAKDFMDNGDGFLARLKLELDFEDPQVARQAYRQLRDAAVEHSSLNGMELSEAERFYPKWEEAAAAPVVLPLPTPHGGGEVHSDHLISNILADLDAKIEELDKEKSKNPSNTTPEKKANQGIAQDPYLRLEFAKKLITYQEEMLDVCWNMKEHLEEARPYMNGSPTYLTMIEQTIGMTAEIQKLLDGVHALGDREIKHANYLIHAIENPFSKETGGNNNV